MPSDNDMVMDGSYGFEDPMETDYTGRQLPTSSAATAAAGTGGGLYSDSLIKTNRWGRGFNRAGRFGGSGR